jgi:hypothetical protein
MSRKQFFALGFSEAGTEALTRETDKKSRLSLDYVVVIVSYYWRVVLLGHECPIRRGTKIEVGSYVSHRHQI